MKNLIRFITNNKTLLVILGVTALIHAWNMFYFPYYENDEGAYMSQAWSLLMQGKLAPYTYWYDHAPGGWILIALWSVITGGFFTFGISVNSGRVFMLVIHVLSSFFLFEIAKKLTKRNGAGILSVLLFSLSPLALYFQRRVLLDNMMIFWILFSLWILLADRLKLRHIYTSAVTCAIAILTKENAVFFLPGFIGLIGLKSHKNHKKFAVINWVLICGSIVSLYFLYAILKTELFPIGFLGDQTRHVSLITSFIEQLSRGSRLPFWNNRSDFYLSLMEWFKKDSVIIIAGITALIINTFLSIKNKALRIPVVFSWLFVPFLIRGKLIIDFYIIPMIPLLALNIALLLDGVYAALLKSKKYLYQSAIGVTVVIYCAATLLSNVAAFTKDETTAQLQAIDWIYEHVPKSAIMAIDSFALLDLKVHGYTNADWFWKMWYDPQIQERFDNNWKKVEYILLTHEMLRQIGFRLGVEDPLRSSLINASQLALYGPSGQTYLDISKFITTNGDWAAMYKQDPIGVATLRNSWQYYKKQFIHSYGQVIDPQTNATTSEGQSYAMLRSVWQNDQTTFNGIWWWTRDHMQYRNEDKLFSWLWQETAVQDSASASDADEDIALALLFAYKLWGDEIYLTAAQEIIVDIWEQEVVLIQGNYYLISGTNAARTDGYLINPSYLSPATYRIFAQFDTKHPWERLAADSYTLLNRLTGGNTQLLLPPNWILIDTEGIIHSAASYVTSDPDTYGYDAFRVFWRISLDYQWFKTPQAITYLKQYEPFFRTQWAKEKSFAATYETNGQPRALYPDLSTAQGALSVLTVANPVLATEVYETLLEKQFEFEKGYWQTGSKYYDQNWAWLGTGIYWDYLKNLAATR